jgi:hypothetical protein
VVDGGLDIEVGLLVHQEQLVSLLEQVLGVDEGLAQVLNA